MQLKFLLIAIVLIFIASAVGRLFGPRDGRRRARRTKPPRRRDR